MTVQRGSLHLAACLLLLPALSLAESQPTSVVTNTFVLTATPDPFSAFSADRMVALPDGTRFVQGGGASNSASANYLLKINPDGTQAWAVQVADPFNAEITGLAADASGNAYVAYTDFSDFSQPHARVVKYSAAGAVAASADLATDTPGGDGFPFSEGVGVDPVRGRVYAAYSFFSSAQGQDTFALAALDTDLQPVATRVYDPGFTGGIGVFPGGGTLVDGNGDAWVVALQLPPAGDAQLLAARFAPDAAGVSPVTLTSPSVEEVSGAADPRGGIIAAGDRQGDGNLYLHRVTAGGFGPGFRFEGFDFVPSPMAVDPAGNLYILGFDPSTFFPAVAKVNSSNVLAWDEPSPYLGLPDTFSPGAVAAANSATFDVASVDFNADPIPVVLLRYQAAASPAAPSLSISSGNDQVVNVNSPTEPLVVEARDAAGTPQGNVAVDFSILSAPTGAAGQQLVSADIQTNSSGRAKTGFIVGNIPLEYEVKADCPSCGATSNSVVFQICGQLPATLLHQNGETWSDDVLDNHSKGWTVGVRGCALTAYTMLLNVFKSRYQFSYPVSTPGTLNSFLTDPDTYGFVPDANLDFDLASERFTHDQVWFVGRFDVNTSPAQYAASARSVMRRVDSSLAAGNPALVQVESTSLAGHFLTVIGRCGSSYLVKDPYAGLDYQSISIDDPNSPMILGARIFTRGE